MFVEASLNIWSHKNSSISGSASTSLWLKNPAKAPPPPNGSATRVKRSTCGYAQLESFSPKPHKVGYSTELKSKSVLPVTSDFQFMNHCGRELALIKDTQRWPSRKRFNNTTPPCVRISTLIDRSPNTFSLDSSPLVSTKFGW